MSSLFSDRISNLLFKNSSKSFNSLFTAFLSCLKSFSFTSPENFLHLLRGSLISKTNKELLGITLQISS